MRLLKLVLLVLLLAATALLAIIATPAGLRGGLWAAERLLPGELSVVEPRGRLLDRFELRRLKYRHQGLEIVLEDLTFAWQPLALARGVLDIAALEVGRARIVTPPAETGTDGPWTLPLDVRIGHLDIGDLEYHSAGTGSRVQRIRGRAYTAEQRLHIASLAISAETFTVRLTGRLALREPWAHDLEVRFELFPPDQPALAGRGQAAGDAGHTRIAIDLEQPSTAALQIDARRLLDSPVWQATLDSERFDLAPWLDVAATAALELRAEGTGEAFRAELALAVSGALEQQIAARMDASLIEDQRLRFRQIDLTSRAQSLTLALAGTLDWAETPAFDLRGDWSIERPQPARGELSLAGGLAGYTLEAGAHTDTPIASRWELRARGGPDAIEILKLDGQLAGGTLEGDGRLMWQPAPALSFSGRWRDLAWSLDGETVHSPQGRFRLEGGPERYTVESEGALRYPAAPALAWQLRGQGDLDGLAVETLMLETLGGRVEAAGELAWKEALQADLGVTLDGLDPGAHWAGWPGELNGGMRLRARQEDSGWRAELRNLAVKGRLRGHPLTAGGSVTATPGQYEFGALRIAVADSVLRADGRLADQSDLRWALDSPDLSQWLPDATGRLHAEGRVRGHWTQPGLRATVTAQSVEYAGHRLGQLAGEADVQTDGDRFSLDVTAADLVVAGRRIAQLSAQGRGRLGGHTVRMDLQENQQRSLRVAGAGQWADGTWSLRLDEGVYQDPVAGDWRLQPALALALQPEAVEIGRHCWRQPPARLCLAGRWQAGGAWAGELALTDYGLDEATPRAGPSGITGGQLALALEAAGTAAQIESIRGELQLADLILQPEAGTELAVPGLTARLEGAVGGVTLTIDGRLGSPATGVVTGRLSADALTLDREALLQSGLKGELRGHIDDLQPLLALYPRFDAEEARLAMHYRVAGHVGSPALDGDMTLTAARVGVPELGLEFEDFELRVTGDPERGLTLAGHTRSGPGRLSLDGRVALRDGALRLPEARLHGERFELLNLPEAWVLASPDLRLRHDGDRLAITGTVHIPEALLQPLERSGAIPVSEDERIVGTETPDAAPPGGLETDTDIRLILGDKVRITARGFEGRLAGELDIRQRPERPARARGELRIVDAEYSAYGQVLKVDSGRILFTGQPIDDPAIEARATRTVDKVTAGVRVTGSVQQPVTELFSTPSMPEADILSYLVVGRPLSEATAGDGDLLLQAATAMGIRNTESLRQSIATTLGLDTLAIDTGNGDREQTRLVVGKYLAPNLYISYGAGLVEAAVNTVRLRYEITDYLSLEAEQGAGTGVDLLYEIETGGW